MFSNQCVQSLYNIQASVVHVKTSKRKYPSSEDWDHPGLSSLKPLWGAEGILWLLHAVSEDFNESEQKPRLIEIFTRFTGIG